MTPFSVTSFDAFTKKEFDLVISDVMMPKKDGFTMASDGFLGSGRGGGALDLSAHHVKTLFFQLFSMVFGTPGIAIGTFPGRVSERAWVLDWIGSRRHSLPALCPDLLVSL